MQIPATQSSPWSSLGMFNKPGTAEGDGKTSEAAATLPGITADETVTVQALDEGSMAALEANQSKVYEPPAEVFAEIWKDGVRVGAVYTDGQAELSGSHGGKTLGNGPMYAQARAEELSRQIGGEVRYVDVAALQVAQVRTQLRSAYGV